jgi:hypothetical protein
MELASRRRAGVGGGVWLWFFGAGFGVKCEVLMKFCVERILESEDAGPGCKDTCVLKRRLQLMYSAWSKLLVDGR